VDCEVVVVNGGGGDMATEGGDVAALVAVSRCGW
jgi:hypothetical protein